MRCRKLRIAWSVVWGLVAVLLCVTWVRSYGGKAGSPRPLIEVGDFTLCVTQGMLHTERNSIVHHPDRMDRLGIHNAYWTHSSWTSQKPLWCILPFLVMTAWAPWICWSRRFTLRTLLIATTLVAVVLGLIMRLNHS
jgi:hypothetical protein